MQKSKLYFLLKTFDKKEIRDFRKFIASPFFNQRQDVCGLFEILLPCLKEPGEVPGKEVLFQKLYGAAVPFDDHKVRMAMSFLLKLAERFLVQQNFFADDVAVKTRLAEVYRSRNLPKHFERTLRGAQQAHKKYPFRNAAFFGHQYRLELEEYRFNAGRKRLAEHNLQAVTDNLDLTFFAQKLRQSCLLLSHQAVYKTDYDFGMLDEVLRHVEGKGLLAHPAIGLYYYCYRALVQPEELAYFQELKKRLVSEGHLFPKNEIADLYLLAINFCIKRYNEDDRSYLEDEFDLFKVGLERGYFLNNGLLSRFTYRNVVTTCLALKAFDWLEQFLLEYKSKLEKPFRESAYNFNLARLEFERKEYGSALQLLQKSEFKDLLLNLSAKAIILKIFYETGEYGALDSHLDAMQRFIRRKKIIGYHRENYLKTILFVRKLMEVYEKKELAGLKEEIKGAKSVAEKGWLLEQCG
ncbi:MAG TPA: hypothetical protein ENJ95_10855 [Bacteroidetes bacterium]|nr:hypothetical protein [Bacteroidota bacterium]